MWAKLFGLGDKDISGGIDDSVTGMSKTELTKLKLTALEKRVRDNGGQRHFTQAELEECLIDLIKIVREGL